MVVLPATLAGAPKLVNPQLNSVLNSNLQSLRQQDNAPTVGTFYGASGVPAVLVIAAAVGAPPGADGLTQVSQGLTSDGGSVDFTGASYVTEGSVTYSCAPLEQSKSSVPETLCVWTEPHTFALLIFFGTSLDPISTTELAYQAIVVR